MGNFVGNFSIKNWISFNVKGVFQLGCVEMSKMEDFSDIWVFY